MLKKVLLGLWKKKSERTELTPANETEQIGFKGNVWQTLSFYVKNFHMKNMTILFGRSTMMVIGHQCLIGQLKKMVFIHKKNCCNDPKFIKRKCQR